MPLEAKNISFRYDRKEPFVLKDINLRVERGERVALFAPSGYGKTTLVKLMSGYLEPTVGQILLDGKPLPTKGICPVQLIYQHPEKAINPRWRLKRVLEESGEMREDVLDAFGIELLLIHAPFVCGIPVVANKQELGAQFLAGSKLVHVILWHGGINIFDAAHNLAITLNVETYPATYVAKHCCVLVTLAYEDVAIKTITVF